MNLTNRKQEIQNRSEGGEGESQERQESQQSNQAGKSTFVEKPLCPFRKQAETLDKGRGEELEKEAIQLEGGGQIMNNINKEEVISKEGGLFTNSEGGLIQTQQSSTSVVDGDMEDGEEELVDYDEDPMVAEKLEMAALERRVESRAMKLLEKAAINIQKEGMEVGKGREGNSKDNTKDREEGSEEYLKKKRRGKTI
jgi:hypothetical protein